MVLDRSRWCWTGVGRGSESAGQVFGWGADAARQVYAGKGMALFFFLGWGRVDAGQTIIGSLISQLKYSK